MAQPATRRSTDVLHDLTRSVCPRCLDTIDAQVLLRDGHVIMRKECPAHGWFESLLSSDAQMYLDSLPYNKPGTDPLGYSTQVVDGCPKDCGLCPDHKQHTCLGLIEVNSHCNLDCPICFADAQPGFSLSMGQVERMLDCFIELEGEVVQFSGGEPTIHPEILPMLRMAKDKGVKVVMLNTNGIRIAKDERFLSGLTDVGPTIYLQFDGFSTQTHEAIRGRDLLETKLKALDRLAEAGLDAVLVPAIEKGVNHDEIGDIVRFGLDHPAVRGVAFQPVTHSGRFTAFDPLDRETVADVVHGIAEQTSGTFVESDFIPCHAATPPVAWQPTPTSRTARSHRCPEWWMWTNTWTTSLTALCPRSGPKFSRPWRAYGRRLPCPAPRRPPSASTARPATFPFPARPLTSRSTCS